MLLFILYKCFGGRKGWIGKAEGWGREKLRRAMVFFVSACDSLKKLKNRLLFGLGTVRFQQAVFQYFGCAPSILCHNFDGRKFSKS